VKAATWTNREAHAWWNARQMAAAAATKSRVTEGLHQDSTVALSRQ
jgi:hypothetical protein